MQRLGVHSIERSAQEDTLLVLFNTAISNLVSEVGSEDSSLESVSVSGIVPQQLCPQSRYYWALPVFPVKFNSTGSKGESVAIPINFGHHYQGASARPLTLSCF